MLVTALPSDAQEKIPTDSFLFDSDGIIQPVSDNWWAKHDRTTRMMFGHHHALYAFPTVEIIETLREKLNPDDSIEIGAGNGGFCKALGIIGTDNYMQASAEIAAIYGGVGQPTVNYGQHVQEIDGIAAVRKYRPKNVLACWLTHKYNSQRHECGGNMLGVDEHELLSLVDNYYFIGNTKVHATKPLFRDLAHGKIETHRIKGMMLQDSLASRASGGVDFIVHITKK